MPFRSPASPQLFAYLPEKDLLFFVIVFIVAFLGLFLVRRFVRIPFFLFLLGLIALILGLWAGSLVAGFFASFPGLAGQWLPPVAQAFVVFVVLDFFFAQRESLNRLIQLVRPFGQSLARRVHLEQTWVSSEVLLDTSALVDGRVEDLAKTGFLGNRLVVPRFVLRELQTIADSAEPIKRNKGRRGIEVLTRLQKDDSVTIDVIEDDFGRGKNDVDAKLIKLAKKRGAKILTVDYNLNQIAAISGIKILNINELGNAIRPAVLPGETLLVNIIQKGKERYQGVGFLPDGTMIVVEDGAKHVGEMIECEVERLFQTVAGKMIFVRPIEGKK